MIFIFQTLVVLQTLQFNYILNVFWLISVSAKFNVLQVFHSFIKPGNWEFYANMDDDISEEEKCLDEKLKG